MTWKVTDIHICFYMDTHTAVIQKEDRGRSGWTTSGTTARRWVLQYMRLLNSLPTGQDGRTLYARWAASAHWLRHCRHGNKSSKSRMAGTLSWTRWLGTYRNCTCQQTVTHPSSNRGHCRATTVRWSRPTCYHYTTQPHYVMLFLLPFSFLYSLFSLPCNLFSLPLSTLFLVDAGRRH